jgi:thiol-disulfide isomerase/thioredoxin
MKKLIFILLICLTISCQNNPSENVIISGEITNAVSETVSILFRDGTNNTTDSLSENTNFKMEFYLEKAQYVSFKHGPETTAMYIKPGDNIQLTIDPNKFDETIFYTGSNASNFLAKKYLLDEKLDRRALYSLPEKEFLRAVNKIENDFYALLNLGLDESFKKNEEKSIWREWSTAKLNYQRYHESISDSSIILSEDYFDFIAEIDVNDPIHLENYDSFNFLKTYVMSQKKSQGKSHILNSFEFLSTHFESQKTTDTIAMVMMKNYLDGDDISEIEEVLIAFKKIHSDPTMVSEMTKLVGAITLLNTGNPAIDFTYPDKNGEERSLSDFRGSYVYVDVWATWCGPCKKEIPDLIKLEKDYHDKNIVFMSVSVDEENDHQTWLDMIEEKQLGGVQLFAAGWSKIVNDYHIKGIPRFMLFDPQGNILDTKAPRPSDPLTRVMFEQLF